MKFAGKTVTWASEEDGLQISAITVVNIDALTPWELNPRAIREERFESLKRSMQADRSYLYARPVIATLGCPEFDDGTVIGGNMRLRAAAALEWDSIPTVLIQSDDADRVRSLAFRDNRPYGEDDDDAMAEILYGMRERGYDLDLTGLTGGEAQLLLDDVAAAGGAEFPKIGDDLEADFCCPRCRYEWSGDPRAGASASTPEDAAKEID